MSRERRRSLVQRSHRRLSVARQCKLGISRSSVYYGRKPTSETDLELMAAMDRQYLETPYFGSRRMQAWLQAQGHCVNRKRVRRLMRVMGLEALYQRPRTSKPSPAAPKHPYLLRGLAITQPDQVWAADITYIPMAKGFLYLVVVMDWYSRNVLAWRLSNTLDSAFCVDALEEALRKGTPEIFNTDQGTQFTSEAFTALLKQHGVQISHDGKGRFMDNIFVERLWRSLKYEEVYLKAYPNVPEARVGIGSYLWRYNEQRPHQALKYRTPAEVYRSRKATQEAGLSLSTASKLSS
jgi:putative transposase